MKKSTRLLLLLALLLLLLGLVAFFALRQAPSEEGKNRAQASQVVLSLDPAAITSIITHYDGHSLTFVRQEGAWVLQGEPAFPLRQSFVNTMQARLAAFGVSGSFSSDDFAQYGLDNPLCSITVTQGKATHTLDIGDRNRTTGDYYLRIRGDDLLYTTTALYAGAFLMGRLDLLTDDLPLALPVTDVTRVALSGGRTFTRGKDSLFVDEQGNVPGAAKITDYLTTLLNPEYIECIDDSIDTFDRALLGFDKPTLQVTLTHTTQRNVPMDAQMQTLLEAMYAHSAFMRIPALRTRITLEEKDASLRRGRAILRKYMPLPGDDTRIYRVTRHEDITLTLGASLNGHDYAFTHSETQRAYSVMGEYVDAALACAVQDLRSPYVCDILERDIHGFTLSTQEKRVHAQTITRYTLGEDGLYTRQSAYLLNGQDISAGAYRQLFGTIALLTTQAYLDDVPSAPLDPAQEQGAIHISFALRSGGEDTLTLVPYDGSFYRAFSNGHGDQLVSKRDVENLLTVMDALQNAAT